MGKYWVLVGFGALFFLCGSASLCAAYSWRQRVKRSFSWPSVQGRVLKSEFGESDKIGSGSGSSYAPVVEYEYTVNDVLYTHDHIEVGGNTAATSGSAKKRAATYPVGSEVTVYFDSEDASNACLERRSWQPVMMTVVGVAGCIFGTPMILYALHKIFRIW